MRTVEQTIMDAIQAVKSVFAPKLVRQPIPVLSRNAMIMREIRIRAARRDRM